MLLTQNNIVYTQLSRKQKFNCLICKENHYDSSCYLCYRFGQFVGYACNDCCEQLKPKTAVMVAQLPKTFKNEDSEVPVLSLDMDLAERAANNTNLSKKTYISVLKMCMRGLILYSRRSKFSRQLMRHMKMIRDILLFYCDMSNGEIDDIFFSVLEYCLATNEITCRKNSAMMRNIYSMLETKEARARLMELEWK